MNAYWEWNLGTRIYLYHDKRFHLHKFELQSFVLEWRQLETAEDNISSRVNNYTGLNKLPK
jgi:hypothetical protein